MQASPTVRHLGMVIALAAAGAAFAAEPPVLKSGLWEVTRVGGGPQPQRKGLTTMCLDESVQAQMREFGMGAAKEMCSQTDRNFDGTRMTVTSTCQLGPTTMKAVSVMTFAGNTAYHMEGTATYDPPMMNMKESKTTADAKWIGACRPGQQPGDVTLENGQTINMKQIMQNK